MECDHTMLLWKTDVHTYDKSRGDRSVDEGNWEEGRRGSCGFFTS